MNQDALGPLLVGLGFTKNNEKVYKFSKSEEDKSLGNLRVLQQAQTFFNQKQAELKNPGLKPIVPQVPSLAKNESSAQEEKKQMPSKPWLKASSSGSAFCPGMPVASQPVKEQAPTEESKMEE